MEEIQEVVIVGAGIAGVATALALKKVGIQSIVLERSHELRTTGSALTLSPNAWRVLDVLGVGANLRSIYHIFQMMHVTNLITGTTQTTSFVDSGDMEVRSVHRKVLLETLANELPPNTIKFSTNITSIKRNQGQDITVLHLEDGSVIKTKALIGCDGVHSVVAQWLGLSAPVESGRSAVRGLAVFPAAHGFKHEVHQFVGNGVRAGLVPMNDTEVYWFLSGSLTIKDEEIKRNPEMIKREVLEQWAKDFPSDFVNVVQHSEVSTITWAPLMFRVPWDVLFGKTHSGAVTVAGDAFHPMTPDLAQGGCAALEDAVVLARCLATSVGNVAKDLERYVKERRWRVAGLITGAFFSGWVQQSGSGWSWWLVKLFRDNVFYQFVFPRLVKVVHYDCGGLPEKEKSS
ncbi:Kynurenine 3-monooxygenase and related flavoprotein monooxygenases protein [Dioscorea alata]|uniref:Kynurenine 3-monooxygenase and related flavoprotein monooxygenases protein n=1 Tax=Dioscorea alata TaxID=55571 RepID=A0ACB7VC60_DIOAL|nr:Kynurenine 3-monooxygenase and related flavoprotein monooxygenases protein [Dioscorea alata]